MVVVGTMRPLWRITRIIVRDYGLLGVAMGVVRMRP